MSSEKIRVMYVVDNLSFGGGERGFIQLSTGLNRERFEASVAAAPGGKFEEAIRSAGVAFTPVDMAGRFSLKTIKRLSDLIRRDKIQVVHTMGSRVDFFGRMAVRWNPETALVCTVAMMVERFDVSPLRKLVYIMADRFSSRYVTRYIAVSKALGDRLVSARKIASQKVSVVYNGVELDRFDPERCEIGSLRASFGIPEGAPVIGSIGRLVFQKGFSDFIRAAQQVYKKNNAVRFMIVGDGPEEDKLKRLADSLGISEACVFTGTRSDVPELLLLFDLFVLSSVLEGFPRIVIEAMAMAKPIVATDIDGVTEQLTDRESGLLIPPSDSQALAGALLSLLDDLAMARRLGLKAREEAVKRFDLKRALTQVESLYEDILKGTS